MAVKSYVLVYQAIFCGVGVRNIWPSSERILKEKQPPLKCLLVIDNATAHHQDLDDDLPGGFDFINVKFLPLNTTPLLQPIDKQVISNFNRLCTKALFRKCLEVTNFTQQQLREFWKYHFTVLNCLTRNDNA